MKVLERTHGLVPCSSNYLHKRLNFGALGHLLLAHGLGDLARVAVDSSHEGVSVTTVYKRLEMIYKVKIEANFREEIVKVRFQYQTTL